MKLIHFEMLATKKFFLKHSESQENLYLFAASVTFPLE